MDARVVERLDARRAGFPPAEERLHRFARQSPFGTIVSDDSTVGEDEPRVGGDGPDLLDRELQLRAPQGTVEGTLVERRDLGGTGENVAVEDDVVRPLGEGQRVLRAVTGQPSRAQPIQQVGDMVRISRHECIVPSVRLRNVPVKDVSETPNRYRDAVRALTYVANDTLAWRELADPSIAGDREAIVRPIAATTCDLDARIIRGRTPFEPPFALGHECVAEVVDIGDRVRTVRPGDVVVVPWHICCGECERCRMGLSAQCRTLADNACFGVPIGGHFGGLFSDLVRVPFADAMLVPVPDGVDPVAAASVSDNLTDAYIAVRHGLQKRPGARVLVHGGIGSLGLFAVDHAVAAGAESVDYVDADPSRRAIAASLGATTHAMVPDEFAWTHPVVIDATRRREDLRRAVIALAAGGHLSSVTISFGDAPMPLWEMYLRDATFSAGRPSVRPHIPAVLRLLERGEIHPERVVSEIVAWNDAPAALVEPSLKPVVTRPRAFARAAEH